MQPVLDRYQGLHAVDYGAIAVYFLAVLFVGYYCSRRQTSTDDYFFAGRRMPWFAVGLSIVATVLSTVTYLSTPGEMIKNGVGANAQLFSYPLIFLLVSYFIIPFLMRQRVTTAYEYLEERFDLRTRIFGASIFILLRTAWMGMVIFTASLALAKICNLPFFAVVLGLAIVGTLYTVLGGLKAVIWTDVLQFFVLLAGALFTLVYVSIDSGTGPLTWWSDIMSAETPAQPIFSFDPTVRLSLVGMGCWTLFWWLTTASGDQGAVQRFLSTESLQAARRSFACNLVAGAVIILLLGLCGIALHSYYKTSLPDDADLVFPHFIRHILPRGLAGLVVAALFSAAMSSLDSGINSISSVAIGDYYRRLREAVPTAAQELRLARVATVAASVAAILISFVLHAIPEEQRGNLFDVTGRITSFLIGSLGGLMLIAILGIRCSGKSARASALCGMAVGLVWAQGHWLLGLPELAWMWVIPVSTMVTVGAGTIFSQLSPVIEVQRPPE